MGLINNERVVLIQKPILLAFSQKNTVSHELDQGVWVGVILKPHFVTHGMADLLPELFCNPVSHGSSRNSSRLSMSDQTSCP